LAQSVGSSVVSRRPSFASLFDQLIDLVIQENVLIEIQDAQDAVRPVEEIQGQLRVPLGEWACPHELVEPLRQLEEAGSGLRNVQVVAQRSEEVAIRLTDDFIYFLGRSISGSYLSEILDDRVEARQLLARRVEPCK
jgi:hypothetical protein